MMKATLPGVQEPKDNPGMNYEQIAWNIYPLKDFTRACVRANIDGQRFTAPLILIKLTILRFLQWRT